MNNVKRYFCFFLIFVIMMNMGLIVYAKVPSIGQKKRVAIAEFTIDNNIAFKGDVEKQLVRLCEEEFADAFISLKRFSVVNNAIVRQLQRERQIKMIGSENLTITAAPRVATKADLYCIGEIESLTVLDKRDTQDKVIGYDASVDIRVKVYELFTGTLIISKVFNGGTGVGGGLLRLLPLYQETPFKAVTVAIDNAAKRFKESIDENIPIEGKIVEIIERDKNNEVFLVSLGSNLGLGIGDRMSIIEVIMKKIDGVYYARQKKIGELRITNVEADGIFSEAVPVDDFGQIIINKYENGQNILIRVQK